MAWHLVRKWKWIHFIASDNLEIVYFFYLVVFCKSKSSSFTMAILTKMPFSRMPTSSLPIESRTLQLTWNVVKMYHHTKNEISVNCFERNTHTHTHTHTHSHTLQKKKLTLKKILMIFLKFNNWLLCNFRNECEGLTRHNLQYTCSDLIVSKCKLALIKS